MSPIVFTYAGILKLLNDIKVQSDGGPDDVPLYILKSCSKEIAYYLAILFTKSLGSGSLPHTWKNANIVSIHKCVAKKKAAVDYRPISLTSVCCEMMEHTVYSAIMKHLEQSSYFTMCQRGFRSGLSCITQLLEFNHDLFSAFDHMSR